VCRLLEGDVPEHEFQPSPFFAEQLRAFELWLEAGSQRRRPPEQLPIVLQVYTRDIIQYSKTVLHRHPAPSGHLSMAVAGHDCKQHDAAAADNPESGSHRATCCRVQVLLSQVHRARALQLLGRFLDLGSWAVDLALSVGIFPYVLKLLQTSSADLRDTLVFIWTKILALDRSCQVHQTLIPMKSLCDQPSAICDGCRSAGINTRGMLLATRQCRCGWRDELDMPCQHPGACKVAQPSRRFFCSQLIKQCCCQCRRTW